MTALLFRNKLVLIVISWFISCQLMAAGNSESLSKISFKREPDIASRGAVEIYLILLCIVILGIVLLWLVKKKQGLQGVLFKGMMENPQQEIKILANKRVNQHTYVHLLEVDKHKIVLAENNQSLTLLKIDDEPESKVSEVCDED